MPITVDAQQGIIAHRQHQPPGKACRRAAAEGKPQMVNEMIQPSRAARPRRQQTAVKPLGEDPTAAQRGVSVESARHDQQTNRAPGDW